jgi:uncharacterized membrane protein YhhN
MTTTYWVGAGITGVALLALLASAWRGSPLGVWITKPLASAGFVLAAWGNGAADSPYGLALGVALVLCLVGDVLLIPPSERVFLLGVGAFGLGHAVFAIAFTLRQVAWLPAGLALALLLAPGLLFYRWLSNRVPVTLRGPVLAYLLVVTTMVTLAIGTSWKAFSWPLLLGAAGFYLSDLSVALDHFVAPGFRHKAWGWPLYFGAQLLLAASL